jgi:NADH:ubiquinone reductase (H+-translocating)
VSANVVVLGTGFAGLTVARALARRRGAPRIALTAVNRENYALFTPMLPEVASGAIEPRHVAEPFRTSVPRAAFVLGEVQGVDFARRSVAARHPVTGEVSDIAYDQLVIALGAVSTTHGVPGADTHTVPLKTLDDAVRLRAQLIRSLEAATVADAGERRALLTVAVVGGGFTGVEAAGETFAYLNRIRREYPALGDARIRVVLVAGSQRLLEQLPERFSARAQAMLARRGVEIVLGDEVASVDAGGLTLKSGVRHAAQTVVWTAGVRVPELVAQLDVPHAAHHAIAVNADLSVPDRPGVWALGDCAHVPKPGGGAYPQTAQHAVHEGALLARNVVAALRGRATRPMRYRSLGMMASLGDREGLADIAGRGLIAGLPAWLLWRAYYLSRLHGAYRKTRVALDWSFALPFPPDIASIGSST